MGGGSDPGDATRTDAMASSRSISLEAIWRAVVVFPQARGPSLSTARFRMSIRGLPAGARSFDQHGGRRPQTTTQFAVGDSGYVAGGLR